jgi:ribosomal protein S18 acetylase RimI-like enzyme
VGLTYFKRFRMEFDLQRFSKPSSSSLADCQVRAGYDLIAYSPELLGDHAIAKFNSFRTEMDANVFPCLGRREGCLRLMREITSRSNFVPEATWLCRFRDEVSGRLLPIGTIQGLEVDGWGAIQNLGIAPEHRGKGLGSALLMNAAFGFRAAGLKKIHLEVTTDNTAAVRLYERLGFQKARVVYKAANVEGAC